MHPVIFHAFDEICRVRRVGGAVLEIGATPDASTLLNLPALAGAAERVGVNLAAPARFGGFDILQADANDLALFPDRRFDTVLCNAVLEHDPFFWKTLAEIRRVTRPGGWVVIGTPGYAQLPWENRLRRFLGKWAWLSGRPDGWPMQHATLTLGVHNFPGDYYRFSEQAYRDVFFAGLAEVAIRTVLVPPRIIGVGRRV